MSDRETIWRVHSNDQGEDEILYGSRDEVITDLAYHHGWESCRLPQGWSLEEIEPRNVTCRHILALHTQTQCEEALDDPRFPISQPWGDGRAYPLPCGEWVVDTGCGYAEEGWCEGYECDRCGEIYTDQYPCACW